MDKIIQRNSAVYGKWVVTCIRDEPIHVVPCPLTQQNRVTSVQNLNCVDVNWCQYEIPERKKKQKKFQIEEFSQRRRCARLSSSYDFVFVDSLASSDAY